MVFVAIVVTPTRRWKVQFLAHRKSAKSTVRNFQKCLRFSHGNLTSARSARTIVSFSRFNDFTLWTQLTSVLLILVNSAFIYAAVLMSSLYSTFCYSWQ